MKVPPFADSVEVVIDGGEITMVCNACGPPQQIASFFGQTTFNQMVNAINDHQKNRKD